MALLVTAPATGSDAGGHACRCVVEDRAENAAPASPRELGDQERSGAEAGRDVLLANLLATGTSIRQRPLQSFGRDAVEAVSCNEA